MHTQEVSADALQRVANQETARRAVLAVIGEWTRRSPGVYGAIDCPICGAKGGLHYHRKENSDMSATCLMTPGCVSWKE